MSIEFILGQLVSIQDRLSQASSLNGEETQRLTGIFQRVNTCSLLAQDREVILSLQGRVTQNPQMEDLQKIFLLLLKNCPDDTIAHFLGLDTWQSEGNTAAAKQRIIMCVKRMKLKLNLCLLSLSSLPSGIGQLTQLQELNFCANDLRFLPPELGQLKQLKTLYCHENQLYSLPDWIGQLVCLERFNCTGNPLRSLPAWIGQLINLKEFSCNECELLTLPPEIGQLTNLEYLRCNGNRLTLPPEIGQLTQLHILHCQDNQLTSLPLVLSPLVHTYLDFEHNHETVA